MAYIPLSHESKLKGKAAIDGVGSRLGKSGGSFIHQGLLMIFSTLSASSPYVAGFLVAVIGLWIGAVRSLGKQFNAVAGSGVPFNDQKAKQDTPSSKEKEPALT